METQEYLSDVCPEISLPQRANFTNREAHWGHPDVYVSWTRCGMRVMGSRTGNQGFATLGSGQGTSRMWLKWSSLKGESGFRVIGANSSPEEAGHKRGSQGKGLKGLLSMMGDYLALSWPSLPSSSAKASGPVAQTLTDKPMLLLLWPWLTQIVHAGTCSTASHGVQKCMHMYMSIHWS